MAWDSDKAVTSRATVCRMFATVLFAMALLLSSCAGPPPKEAVPELYWPFPPERPRIKFVDVILGSLDATGERADKFKNVIFGTEGEVRFSKPEYIAVKGDKVLVTDLGRIHLYDFGKKRYSAIGVGNLTSATGIAITSEDWIFVGDAARRRVLLFTPESGEPTPFGDPEDFSRPSGIAVDDSRRRVFIADALKHMRVGLFIRRQEALQHRGPRTGNSASSTTPMRSR